MGTPEHPDLAAGLIDGSSRDANAAEAADRLGLVCAEIDTVLSPILGRRGVAALMHRSLRVASATHPWLAVEHGDSMTFDPAALTASVAAQDPVSAVAGAVALISIFRELVASLIGASLTERLVGPVLRDIAPAPTAPGYTE